MAVAGDDLYVVGTFKKAGNPNTAGIARWNMTTQTWHTVGSGAGPTGGLYAVAVAGNTVYVGGNFTHIDGVPANNIVVWNGTTWSALAGGVLHQSPNEDNVAVNDIGVNGEAVYVAGSFR